MFIASGLVRTAPGQLSPHDEDLPIPVASIVPPGGTTSNAGLSGDE
jgi:hypothetical protein